MKRYIPKNSKTIEQKETGHIIYTYGTSQGVLLAIGYGGRRSKPDFHYRYNSTQDRAESITKFLATKKRIHDEVKEEKEIRKLEKKRELGGITIGDIFHSGWGYEQTQCDFYQIIDFKGQTATLREIHAITVKGSEGMDCDRRKASKDDFCGEPFKKRLNGNRFTINDYQRASKVADPKNTSFYCSWYH